MKTFLPFEFDVRLCIEQLTEFQQLLARRRNLSEREEILPFFRNRPHLSAFVGTYHPKINRYDRIAFEYDLFGDFASDLVIGDYSNNAYCFVEFEAAESDSIFRSKSSKITPEWSPRFEQGLSQLIIKDFK
ncbi:Shedu anti-phage system protein SduA domain-containing protein [Aerosakkonemataceae cyanobacterium BLCC-F154]|uniref:Shedu anti-phage system protein SduA domain-containing protein n=1 Tax=Floridaenema fluviatile BLCC-F154 TaxID=3153640 RepID=A0ABV4YL18_9CYAN